MHFSAHEQLMDCGPQTDSGLGQGTESGERRGIQTQPAHSTLAAQRTGPGDESDGLTNPASVQRLQRRGRAQEAQCGCSEHSRRNEQDWGADGGGIQTWAAHTSLMAQLKEQITPCDEECRQREEKRTATLRRRGQPREPSQNESTPDLRRRSQPQRAGKCEHARDRGRTSGRSQGHTSPVTRRMGSAG
ncbi:unnamed protein product [Rangifer tarandus platyrhynchus]|uniref:Uncharacterized protein n=1 Tax=Rangifer tarandus platyrhynchus TaxID=3082113 RepID=A0ABN8Y3L4_RANTA|nr:unnamed protein product [Rangifer tarandus platyrhynchus]